MSRSPKYPPPAVRDAADDTQRVRDVIVGALRAVPTSPYESYIGRAGEAAALALVQLGLVKRPGRLRRLLRG